MSTFPMLPGYVPTQDLEVNYLNEGLILIRLKTFTWNRIKNRFKIEIK